MPETLGYLASPYTRDTRSLVAAFQDICRIAARLHSAGIYCYSPIAHLHSFAVYGELDPLNLTLWLPHNQMMMDRCDCLIVAQMPGWDESDGIKGEVEYFEKVKKPIFDLEPNRLVLTKREYCDGDVRMKWTLGDMGKFSGPRPSDVPAPLAWERRGGEQ